MTYYVGMKIAGSIHETYPGSQWFGVEITLSGYGCKEDGSQAGRFRPIPAEHEYLGDLNLPFFRAEYAKAIKRALDQTEVV
jgi:hypothetical protein